jgi:hypothetical protein
MSDDSILTPTIEYYNTTTPRVKLCDSPTPKTDNRIIQDWLNETAKAIEAMRVFQAYLRGWQHHPNLGRLPDDAFMSVIQDMAQAGMMGWLDRPELDALRAAVTGGER